MGYVGFQAGLGTELVKTGGLVAGFFVSFRIYQGWGDSLAGWIHLSAEWAGALAMTLWVILVYLAVTRLLGVLGKLVQVNFQEKVGRFGGLLVGMGRGLLTASVILVICQQLPSPHIQASIEEHSFSGRFLSRAAPAVYDGLNRVPVRLLEGLRGSGGTK